MFSFSLPSWRVIVALRRSTFSSGWGGLALSLGLAAFVPNLQAETKYVSATAPSAAGVWATPSHWDPTGVPTASDDVVFDWAFNPTLSQFALHTGVTGTTYYANSLTFGSAAGLGAFAFQSGNSGTTARTLSLTSGSLTVTSDVTGTQSIGTAGGILTLDAVDGSFEITNHSTQALNITARLSDATPGTSVTINGTSTGVTTLSGINSFTGGLTINAGTLTASSAAALSSGPVTLGGTSGSSAATLNFSSLTLDNDINVRAGSSGLLTIQANGTTTVNGAISLANNLTILKTTSSTTGTFTGGITGTGNVTLLITGGSMVMSGADINHVGTITEGPVATNSSITISSNIGPNVTGIIESNTLASGGVFTVSGAITVGSGGMNIANTTAGRAPVISGGFGGTGNVTFSAGGAGNITVSTNSVNNAGTITNNGIGIGTTTITGGIGSNVTGINQNSTTSALTISTAALNVNGSGTTLTNTAGTKLLTVSGGTAGTGNLILNNNSSTAAGITLSTTSVNHTGTLTNSGTGTGDSTISAVIGTNVTGVVQDSATSQLILSGANLFTSGLTVKQGTAQLGVATAAGTGTITLGDSSGSAAANLVVATGSATIANAIALNSGGTLALVTNGTNNINFSGGIPFDLMYSFGIIFYKISDFVIPIVIILIDR